MFDFLVLLVDVRASFDEMTQGLHVAHFCHKHQRGVVVLVLLVDKLFFNVGANGHDEGGFFFFDRPMQRGRVLIHIFKRRPFGQKESLDLRITCQIYWACSNKPPLICNKLSQGTPYVVCTWPIKFTDKSAFFTGQVPHDEGLRLNITAMLNMVS